MEPKYSVLLCNQDLAEYEEKIADWLHAGVKVIWFGMEKEVETLLKKHASFSRAFLLLAYTVTFDDAAVIVDGNDEDGFVSQVLTNGCRLFNSAQYLVEHCKDDRHIIVQASAGTGKTTVMIDRIMYLIHMIPDIHLYDIFMITFTNDATDQMNQRLQDALMERYYLTGNKRYLRWVEEQSQMNISTIHRFALFMLKEYGIGEGFTKLLSVRSFQYERKELIKDVIDGRINENISVRNQLGVPFYRANGMVSDFWNAFAKIGISHKDLEKMNWGNAIDAGSAPFQKTMSGIIKDLDEKYFDIKRKNEAISVDDIMRDLQEVLQSEELPNPDISMKYLFIDEFQDSDLSQIKVACMMVNLLHPYLFVVGDVKQSIYGFRGATDQAFSILKRDMEEMGIEEPVEYTLVNNYRTSASVLKGMEPYFSTWGRSGSLSYDKTVVPFNKDGGQLQMIHGKKKDELDEQIACIAEEALDELIEDVENGDEPPNEKTRVVMLVRYNRDLRRLAAILRKHKIPAVIRTDGSFYQSEAVRDFYIMVSSFMFSEEPKYIFNYLLTPYAGDIMPMNLNDMEWLHADYDNLIAYLDPYLEQTNWKKYHKDLRLRPVLAVLKEILDNESVVDQYIINLKTRLKAAGWEDDRCNAKAFSDAMQYQADLEKLMETIQKNLNGDKVSLYDVYNFLKLNIATNRTEAAAEVVKSSEQQQKLYKSILCMTVHKAKGLEFDTVILPFTNEIYKTWDQTEVVIDPVEQKVGWNYTGDKEKKDRITNYPAMGNSLYKELKRKNIDGICKEEARILYVAMTRTIRNLICIVPNAKDNTWASLIEEVGGIKYE